MTSIVPPLPWPEELARTAFVNSAIAESIRALQESLQVVRIQIEPHLNALAEAAASMRGVAPLAGFLPEFKLPDLSRIFTSLPDPEQIRAALDRLEPGAETLKSLGYGYTVDMWPPSIIQQVGRGQLSRRALHDAFREHTRGGEFAETLSRQFQGSARLRRRWGVVAAALRAHNRREYVLSIPPLLAQLEGVVTDLLLLRGQASVQGRKVIAKENGATIRRSDGKLKALPGLASKIEHSRYRNMGEVRAGAEFMLNEIVPIRNAILHGNQTTYGSAKLSVQLLFVLWMYAELIVAVEHGRLR